MPFLPPPPPPGPPPPPSFSLNSKESSKTSGGDGRDLLLQSIRQGTKLKKSVTNDRSAPLVSAKGNTSASSTLSKSNTNNGNSDLKSNGVPAAGLGGLFAGGMPKLKPTGRGIGGGSPAMSSSSSGSDQMCNSIPQQQEATRRPFPADLKNRGPPPQPPPSSQKPNISSSISDTTLSNVSPVSLGKRGINPPIPTKPPVSSHGKPNLAPKPPGASTPRPPPPPTKPSPPAKSPGTPSMPPSLPSRPPSVTRAQSMRAPRSPGPLPSPELGDFRGPRFQSQDALHCVTSGAPPPAPAFPPPPRTSTLPSNLNGLQQANGVQHIKGAAPPPPPLVPPAATLGHRTAPAPPQYARPGPLRAPLARPPPPPSRSVNPPLCPPPPPPTTAPPPPPHRTTPAPPPPKQTKLPVNAPQAPSGAPPPPPVRNSSMRNGSQSAVDFEARYAELFHSLKEFPPPDKYTNCVKVYNSKSGSHRRNAGRMPDVNAKQPAPQPPLTHLQIGNKMWANETSIC